MLFQPQSADVRRFFCQCYHKSVVQALPHTALEPMEILASLWIAEHPEYHPVLADLDTALAHNYDQHPGGLAEGAMNPFLHLSMHLSISEQCSIDQPRGIRAAVEKLCQRKDDLHAAHHEVMGCLGSMLWDAQQNQRAPDGHAYIEAVLRKATHD